jgi:3-methyl-2-oxobutanoate hydroxymethyltransferase
MSVTTSRHPRPSAQPGSGSPKVTVQTIQDKKLARVPIACLTAYDYPTARLVDESGIDLILVGDSLAMVVLGYDSTLPVTMDEMLHHTRAVRRAVHRAMVVADMPFGSYHASIPEAVTNAARFLKEAGAEAVKIEGGAARVELVTALTAAEIPVLGHIGLTPQSLHKMGGYKVQGKTIVSFDALVEDARALEAAGCFAIVLEGIPSALAASITEQLTIPTIGIGAGPSCDGQILVFHDLVNLTFSPAAKFVRHYADAASLFRDAITHYCEDVVKHNFPSEAESYHLPKDTALQIDRRSKEKLSLAASGPHHAPRKKA